MKREDRHESAINNLKEEEKVVNKKRLEIEEMKRYRYKYTVGNEQNKEYGNNGTMPMHK